MHSSVEHVHGPEEVPYGTNELVVVCLVRNGEPYVKSFVEHHFSLGARHIVFLDNGSEDETVSVVRGYGNVTVLHTGLSYKKYSLLMKQYLIHRFGGGRWVLCADVDELFDYPYSDTVGLASLLEYLNHQRYTAVAAHMLDMFPDGPLSERTSEDDEPLKESHDLYDLSDITAHGYGLAWRQGNVIANEGMRILRGGIRKAAFGVNVGLTKHPLVLMDDEIKPMANSSHRVRDARIADFAGVLFHYKFVAGFREYMDRAVREENYHDASAEYKKYSEALDSYPGLQIKRETARRLRSTNELVGNGFLVVSEQYMDWVEQELREKAGQLRGAPRNLAETLLLAWERERKKAARIRELEQRVEQLEKGAANNNRAEALEAHNSHLRLRVRDLERQLRSIRSSRSWKLVRLLAAVKSRFPGREAAP